jgi:hypothetical protein
MKMKMKQVPFADLSFFFFIFKKKVPQALHPGGQHYPQISRSPERDDLQMSGARISPP